MRRFFENLSKEKTLAAALVVVFMAGIISSFYSNAKVGTAEVFAMPASKKIVVIDAGHGGWDPGMIGVSGVIEKDVNLKIAEKLQSFFELGGATALVTRAEDEALADRKRGDLKARSDLAEKADVFISIHQNQYPSESVKGTQVFYYTNSDESKRLGECVQKQAAAYLDPTNKKLAKANNQYYLLKNASAPSIIVECGFLSNRAEEKLLDTDEYQEKVAWAIYMGVLRYFTGE